MKKFLAIGLLLIGASLVSGQTNHSTAVGQSNCTLTMVQAPGIGGLRLGMTVDQMLALFPGSREDSDIRNTLSRPANAFGATNFIIRPEKYASKAKFAEISQINVGLVDGRISNFYVGYKPAAWNHVDEFVAKFTRGTNLPAPGAWEAQVGLDNQLKTLRCKNFEISIFAGGKVTQVNYVKMSDMEALKKIKERRTKAREAKAAQ